MWREKLFLDIKKARDKVSGFLFLVDVLEKRSNVNRIDEPDQVE